MRATGTAVARCLVTLPHRFPTVSFVFDIRLEDCLLTEYYLDTEKT